MRIWEARFPRIVRPCAGSPTVSLASKSPCSSVFFNATLPFLQPAPQNSPVALRWNIGLHLVAGYEREHEVATDLGVDQDRGPLQYMLASSINRHFTTFGRRPATLHSDIPACRAKGPVSIAPFCIAQVTERYHCVVKYPDNFLQYTVLPHL